MLIVLYIIELSIIHDVEIISSSPCKAPTTRSPIYGSSV